MNQKKLSSRVYSYARAAVAAAVLPVFLIYIMIDKPDYKIMNGLSHVVLPVANWVGDVITWPVRAIGNAAVSIRELSVLRQDNQELRAKLVQAQRTQHEYEIAIAENQRLTRELDIVRATPQKSIVAGITYDNRALGHDTFLVNKGAKSGINPGMAVVSFDGMLLGVVSDVGAGFARVRALGDIKSNIPVRVAGTQVYGFLQGNGDNAPTIGFFSDPEFQPSRGLKLVTSNIRGVLPDGIMVGELINSTDARVLNPARVTDVMVLGFDGKDRYR